MKWINVKESFPEECDHHLLFLVYVPKKDRCIHEKLGVMVARIASLSYGDYYPGFISYENGYELNPSHWMKLPGKPD